MLFSHYDFSNIDWLGHEKDGAGKLKMFLFENKNLLYHMSYVF